MHARTGSTQSIPYTDPYGRPLSHQQSQPDLRYMPGQSRESLVRSYPPDQVAYPPAAPIDTRGGRDAYMQPSPYGMQPSPYSTEPSPYSAGPPSSSAPLLCPQHPPPDRRDYR